MAVVTLLGQLGCQSEGPPDWPPGVAGCESPGSERSGSEAAGPGCRPMYSGEGVINEVVIRPAGRDLDGDGISSGRDELLELVNLAAEPVHLRGAELWWGDARRGTIADSPCLPPGHAALIVGSTTGPFSAPTGSWVVPLDKTLRLSDGGGTLRLLGLAGGVLDAVSLLPATDARRGCVARRADGQRGAPLVPHQDLVQAGGATMSPGRCSDGRRFPGCVEP